MERIIKLHKNGNSLRRTIFFVYIVISFVWITNLTYRLKAVETVLRERTIYVEKIIDLNARVLQIEKDIDSILKHHVELYGAIEDEKR